MPKPKYPISPHCSEDINNEVMELAAEVISIWYGKDGNKVVYWHEVNINPLLELRGKIDEIIDEIEYAKGK